MFRLQGLLCVEKSFARLVRLKKRQKEELREELKKSFNKKMMVKILGTHLINTGTFSGRIVQSESEALIEVVKV
jgi:hypothetical protein